MAPDHRVSPGVGSRTRLVYVLAVGVVVLVGSRIYLSQERTKDREEEANLARAMAEADQTGNHVVNARSAGEKPRSLAVLVGKEERFINASEPAIPLQDAAFCVVFVHGFNNSFATCVMEGNTLCAEIRSEVGEDAFKRIWFFSFCWRGDYGVLRFDASNDSARRTAPALAYFLTTLARTPPASGPRKIIVVTHSLGALLALESLHTIEHAMTDPLVDTLLMIQPAVKIDLLGRATIEQVYSVPLRGRLDPQVPEYEEMPSYQNNGVYFDTIAKATRLTLATASSKDAVLTWAFDGAWAAGIQDDHVVTWPLNRIALGTLVKDRNRGWAFPKNFEIFDLTPNPNGSAGVRGHSDVFDPRNPALRKFLFDEVNRRSPAGP